MIQISGQAAFTIRFFVLVFKCFPSSHFRPSILSCTQRENLTWSRWPSGSSASAALHGILGPCSSCVPIREPWLMWPVLAFHLGSPAPHLALAVRWSTTNCHRLGLLGRDCPPILLIDSWSSHSAQVSPHHISLDLTHNMEWNIILTLQVFPSISGIKKTRAIDKLKRRKRELWWRLFIKFMKIIILYTFHSKEVGKIRTNNTFKQAKELLKILF